MAIVAGRGIATNTPLVGRGAWPAKGTGGTLSLDGASPGRFYRAPRFPAVMMPGKLAWTAVRLGIPVDINEYAVHLAVKAIQTRCGMVADGLFGPNTADAVKAYQDRAGLIADGVVGNTTAKHMFKPLIVSAVEQTTNTHGRLAYLVGGFLAWESGFDPGAVGVTTPVDLGLGQINGPAHPTMTVEQRFDPVVAVGFVTALVEQNLDAFTKEADGIAAYNLGREGTRRWIAAGRPAQWGTTNVAAYIAAILQAAATV